MEGWSPWDYIYAKLDEIAEAVRQAGGKPGNIRFALEGKARPIPDLAVLEEMARWWSGIPMATLQGWLRGAQEDLTGYILVRLEYLRAQYPEPPRGLAVVVGDRPVWRWRPS